MKENIKEMVTRSVYVDKSLWEKASRAAEQFSLSLIITMLLKKWIAGEISLTFEPAFLSCPNCGTTDLLQTSKSLNANQYRCNQCGLHFGNENKEK
jgi:predicted RNA-binding Zn-ribbon protein involved in translation (DUF1610 family)